MSGEETRIEWTGNIQVHQPVRHNDGWDQLLVYPAYPDSSTHPKCSTCDGGGCWDCT